MALHLVAVTRFALFRIGERNSQGSKSQAPEVLTTPGASFLVAGGRYDTVCDLPVPLMLPVAGQVAARAA
jgi:hypothetical protein